MNFYPTLAQHVTLLVFSNKLCHKKHLVMVDYAYFPSIMNYGIIFWGKFPYCFNIFRLQKKKVE